MKNYTLTLITGQTTDFTVSLNGSALTTTEFANTFIEAAGSAQFTFDTASTGFTIWDSSAMDGKSISGTATVTATDAYEGTWAANSGQTTNTFTAFAKAEGVAMTKYQISDLMSRVKGANSIPTYEYASTNDAGFTAIDSIIPDIKTSGFTGLVAVKNTSTTNRMAISWSGGTTGVVLNYYSIRPGAVALLDIVQNDASSFAGVAFGVSSGGTIHDFGVSYWGFYKTNLSNQLNGRITPDAPSVMPAQATSGRLVGQQSGVYMRAILQGNAGGSTNYLGGSVRAWTSIGSGSNYTKRAYQVTVNISETSLTLTADDWNSLFTLPANFRPTIAMEGTVSVLDSGVIETSYVKVNTDGTVQVRAFGSTTEVHGSIVFPVSS